MPPLERRINGSPGGADIYVSVFGNHECGSHGSLTKKGRATDDFAVSTEPLDLRQRSNHEVFAERDVIFGTNPLYEYALNDQTEATGTQQNEWSNHSRMDILDIFTNLCICRETFRRKAKNSKRVAVASKKRVVYPIAKYPGRLNSPYLVQQRLLSLQKHITFRPVNIDELKTSRSALHTISDY
jgi:hypothetical protein